MRLDQITSMYSEVGVYTFKCDTPTTMYIQGSHSETKTRNGIVSDMN